MKAKETSQLISIVISSVAIALILSCPTAMACKTNRCDDPNDCGAYGVQHNCEGCCSNQFYQKGCKGTCSCCNK